MPDPSNAAHIVQVAVDSAGLYAVDQEGRIWFRAGHGSKEESGEWVRIPPPLIPPVR